MAVADQVLNGAVYMPEWGEYAVFVDDEYITVAGDYGIATRIYHEALATRRAHVTRNRFNVEAEIPMDGSYVSNDSITGPQDIGLVAGVDY